MSIARFVTLAALFVYGASGSARADELPADVAGEPVAEPTTIDAQRLEIYLDREMRAFGDAEIHSDGQVITGDRIDYNTVNRELHATGNVRIVRKGTTVDGSELRLKLDEREGEMAEPVFHMGIDTDRKSRGSARTMWFEGPDKERLERARYTTCEDGRDDWFLRASELEIDHHADSATATHASIEFQGVPILYSPWLDFSFGKQRKTGFLTPTYGMTSRSGFDLALPYYWNIAPDMDATLTPRYLSKRGVQWQGEYRYLDAAYQGVDIVEYLPSDSTTGKDRYYANLKHNQVFGGGWSGGFQFERVSDDQYLSDLSTHVVVTSRVNLVQQGNLRYDTANWHFSALAQQFQTLDKASYPYQRLPQLAVNGLEEVGPVDASLAGEFVRFDRSASAPVAVTGDRVTAYPSMSLPLTRSFGYLTPKVGVHYTQYSLNNAGTAYDSANRSLPIFSLDSGLFFERDMRVVKNRYTQTLEPRVYYVYIPSRDQSRLPIFDTGLSDLNLATIFSENQFSGGDRINDANQVTLGLTSRMIEQKSGSQRLAMTVAERFYFRDQTVVMPGSPVRTGMHSDLFTAVTANLLNHWYANAAWQYNTDLGLTEKGNLSARYQPEVGRVLNLAYRHTRNSLEQIDASGEWPLGGRWYGLGRLNYSLHHNPPTDKRGIIESLAGFEYDAGCWQGRIVLHRLATATAQANTALYFQLELGSIGLGNSPLDVIKRNIPGYTSTGLIPDLSR